MQLYEQYRPATWGEVVGQDKAVAVIQRLAQRGLGGRAIWVSGASGTGKSTIALLAAREIADDFMIRELDASGLTLADLRDIERQSHQFGLGKGGQAFLVNEAHGLRKDTLRQLLVMLERVPEHCLWVFTTTNDGQESLFDSKDDAGPLLSRCVRIDLARRGLARPFAERVKAIAQAEGLDGQPIERYVKLAQKCRNNCRAMIQAVEAGALRAE